MSEELAEETLKKMLNTPVSITLGGKEFKASSPTLQDLSDAQQHVKQAKKVKRKEALQERIALMQELPKDLTASEKKELLDSFLPPEITPQEKLKLIDSLPLTLSDEEKQKRLALVLIEKDGTEWSEAVFLLYKCLQKNHPDLKLEDVEKLVTLKDLKNVLKVINPSDEGVSAKKE